MDRPGARRRLAALLALPIALALGACDDDDAALQPFGGAVASRDCAPTDGPAVTIRLARSTDAATAVPRLAGVVVSIFTPLEILAGGTYRIAADGAGQGFASRWNEWPDDFAPGEGSVTIASVEADLTVVGRLDLRFRDDTRLRQSFRASWLEGGGGCG